MNTYISLSHNLMKNDEIGIKIEELKKLDITGFRINVSKWNTWEYSTLLEKITTIVNKHHLTNYKLIFDLPYPSNKMRIIKLKNGYYDVKENQKLILKVWNNNLFVEENSVYLESLDIDIRVGETIYFADGYGMLICTKKNDHEIQLESKNNFTIYEGKSFSKGLTKTNDIIELSRLCHKLLQISNNVFFALSFVESELEIKKFIEVIGCSEQHIISKIETQAGVDNVVSILSECGGILLGRGDLYYYSKPCDFFKNCNKIANITLNENKDFYLCTDVLISLMERNIPSRADIIDISYFKSLGCTNFVLPAGVSKNENCRKAIEFIEM